MWLDLDAIFNPEGDQQASTRGAEPAPSPCPTPDELPPDWHFEWDERAAIMEFEGGLPREHAEACAMQDILAQMHGETRPTWPEARP